MRIRDAAIFSENLTKEIGRLALFNVIENVAPVQHEKELVDLGLDSPEKVDCRFLPGCLASMRYTQAFASFIARSVIASCASIFTLTPGVSITINPFAR